MFLFILGDAGDVEIPKITAGRHEFDDLLDEENFAIDIDRMANYWFFIKIENRTWMAAINHHDADFINRH